MKIEPIVMKVEMMSSNSFLAEMLSYQWAMEPKALESFLCSISNLDITAMVVSEEEKGEKKKLNIRDGVAHIAIEGPMLKRVSPFLKAFGIRATSTEDVSREITEAVENNEVKSIMLDIDSPGGIVSGVSELADTVRAASDLKPVSAHVSDMMASAAYWVGSQARTISANPSSTAGNIGVYTVVHDSSDAAQKAGVKVHVVSSSPLKGAGVQGSHVTDAQLEDSKRLVDDYADMFRSAVSRGRPNANIEKVATGQIWLAKEAIELGLIDKISSKEAAHTEASSAIVAQTAEHLTCNQDVAGAIPANGSKNYSDSVEIPLADLNIVTPQTGATENEMEVKTDPGTGAPVTTSEELSELKRKAAEADALKAQLLAVRGEALLAKYADRIAPSAMDAMRKMIQASGDNLETAEKALAGMPSIVHPDRKSEQSMEVVQTKEEKVSEADKQLMATMGLDSTQDLRWREALSDNVKSVRSDGKAILKDGRILDRESLKKALGFASLVFVLLFGTFANATALTQARATICKGTGVSMSYLMTASSTIYKGGLVMISSAGTAEAAAASASNNGVVGVAMETKTSAASGSYWIKVQDRVICKFAGTTLAQTGVGNIAYAEDDQTFDETVGSNQPIAGIIVQYDSASVGWLYIDANVTMGRTNSITEPLTLTADLTFASAEYIDNDTDGAFKFVGAGATNNEDFLVSVETAANTLTWTSTTGVVKQDFGAVGTTLQLANDQTIVSDTDNEIQLGDGSEDISFGFGTSNEVTVTTDSGVTRVDFEDIGVKTTNPLFFVGQQYFCGQGANGTTTAYIGPVTNATAADLTTYVFGAAGCDGLDSTTETTADNILGFGSAFEVIGMRCHHAAGGTDDTYTFQLRDDAASVTGVTCTTTLDGSAKGCSVILDAPVAVGAGSAMAVSQVASTDDNMSAVDTECIVYYTHAGT